MGAGHANDYQFRDIPPGDDYIYHYPNNVKYAFGDLSASFKEHADYLWDDSTSFTNAQVPTVVEGICEEARFNGIKLTIEGSYLNNESENQRRMIVNQARSEGVCEDEHLLIYASTPDYYDSFNDDYAGVEDDYVDGIADYIFTYWPEFVSPLTGAQVSKSEMVSIMNKLDAEL